MPYQGPGEPPISSLTFLQLMAISMLMAAFTQDTVPNKARVESAVGVVSQALEAAWPSAADAGRQATERHLIARRWVPDLEQEAQPGWRSGALNPTAAALKRDLARHTPEVGLTELHCLALLQRVTLTDMAPAPATSAERAQREMQQLLDCQQVLALCSGAAAGSLLARLRCTVAHHAVLAAVEAKEPVVRGRGAALNDREDQAMALAEAAVQSAVASKRECRHELAMLLVPDSVWLSS